MITTTIHFIFLNSCNYDVVLDCTDNVPSRYLLNDACVLLKKPLVSGSAISMEGQMTIYNYKDDGPCYRCIHPKPPSPQTVGNCSNSGVLGVVPGIIGCLQALECIKIITNCGEVSYKRLVLFDAMSTQFRNIKLPPKRRDCLICSQNPSITQLIDYEIFAGCKANDKITVKPLIDMSYSISVHDYHSILSQKKDHVLLDVRSKVQYAICKLDHSVNIPLAELEDKIQLVKQMIQYQNDEQPESKHHSSLIPLYVICRRGMDSQRAVSLLEKHNIVSVNIWGGINEWADKIDNLFPTY
eukprot:TRINITY_DN4342_c0_g1_i2.p1 TRINITY_DN4342_c0_g1~~TRINITY_DN4342_c0_g1_i2.p1  ORF type:complete len:298 (-),score=43.49 TRINITY_DN4342_c0_g1_i2:124-1017(-)